MTMNVISCVNVFINFFLAKKQAHLVFFTNALQAIAFFAASIFLISNFGLPGMLVAECISYLVSLLAAIIFFSIKVEINYKIFNFLLKCVPFIIFFIISIFSIDYIQPVIIRFITSVIIVVFLALFFWQTVLSQEDKHALKIGFFQKIPLIRTIFSK